MTGPPNGRPPGAGGEEPEFARAQALAGLAREVDTLRRTLDPLRDAHTDADRVEDLARLVGQLTDAVTALAARPAPRRRPVLAAAPRPTRPRPDSCSTS